MLLKVFLGFFAFLCLFFGVNYGLRVNRVFVKESSDVVLPCSPGNQDLRSERFQWLRDYPNGSKTTFGYVQGIYSGSGLNDQDPQFRGRVSHFEDELQHGNASIKIHNTKVEDSGNYTCKFPRLEQIFSVELVVDAASLSHIKLSDATLLRCDVQGTSSAECQCSVNQNNHCRCVVTDGSEDPWWGCLISGFVGLVIGWSTLALAIGVIIIVAPRKIFALVRRCHSDDHMFGPVPVAKNAGNDLEKVPSSTSGSSPALSSGRSLST